VLLVVLPFAVFTAAAVLLSAGAIYRHDRFGSFGFDLGIFDQTIWGYSHLHMLPNTVRRVPNLLGDHFHPVLTLLAPAYWVWNDVRVLLVAQAVLLASASLPIYYWAQRRLGTVEGLSMQLAFLVFWGTLAGAVFDFHELAVAVPAISFALYALLERRNVLFCCMLVLGCLAKEDIALTFLAMGLYAVLVQRRVRFGIPIACLTAAWFLTVTQVVIPAIAGTAYKYWSYRNLGDSLGQALAELGRRPYKAITLALDRWEKVRTLLLLVGAWSFLPLLSPLFIVAIPSLVERFWSTNPSYWSTKFQYSLPLAPILAFAAADTLARSRRLLDERLRRLFTRVSAGAIVVATLVITLWVVRPLAQLESHRTASEAAEVRACLGRIPGGASVAASNSLVPHLSHRRHVYPLFVRSGQTYLAVDTASDVGRRAAANIERGSTRGGPVYDVDCSRGRAVVFRRVSA
jgi:uncharacterized membrane protein